MSCCKPIDVRPGRVITDDLYAFIVDLYWMGCAACLLLAVHRIAAALKLSARVKAFEELEDAFTSEEREQLVRKIKLHSLPM